MATPTPGGPRRPTGRVAAGTHEQELERFALQEEMAPGTDLLATQVFLWLSRAYQAASAGAADSLRPTGVSLSGFNVLMALNNTPGHALEPRTLAERLLVTRPSITGLLDTLQARALVTRTPHACDRRRILVTLTEAGLDLLRCTFLRHQGDVAHLFSGLTPDEQEHLVRLLRKIDGAVPTSLGGRSRRHPGPANAGRDDHG